MINYLTMGSEGAIMNTCNCRSGEIGRHTILRGWRLNRCAGSSPAFGTIKDIAVDMVVIAISFDDLSG